MKKFNFKNLAFIALGAFSVLFSSCDGVIFHTIREEVELDDASIYGDISGIVRYQMDGVEHLFVANGEIYQRSVADDVVNSKIDWASFTTPSGYIYALAADSSNLYALSVNIEKDDDGYNIATSRTVFCYANGTWNAIFSKDYSSTDVFKIFCTNTPKNANRKAYFRNGTSVWELSGTTKLTTENKMSAKESLADGETFSDFDNKTTPTYSSNSCAYFKGSVYFSSSGAFVTNENIDAEASYIYRVSSGHVYYSTDASAWTDVNLDCNTIISVGITSDYLLAGTSKGIVHTPLKSDSNSIVAIPTAGNVDFSTNADSTLSSYYEIQSILVVHPEKSEIGGTIFATSETSSSSASLNNVGLWGYYASKGEWNRE